MMDLFFYLEYKNKAPRTGYTYPLSLAIHHRTQERISESAHFVTQALCKIYIITRNKFALFAASHSLCVGGQN